MQQYKRQETSANGAKLTCMQPQLSEQNKHFGVISAEVHHPHLAHQLLATLHAGDRRVCHLYGAYIAYILDVSVGFRVQCHVLGSHLQHVHHHS